MLVAAGPAQAGGPSAITDGVLTWGLKGSWRGYAGQPQLTGGVTQPDPWSAEAGSPGGAFEFPVSDGEYDPETGTTQIQATGTIHWQKYAGSTQTPPAGWTGGTDLYVLDVTFTDPAVTISPDGAYVTADVVARSFFTWELVDYGRVRMADLQVAGKSPSTAGGTTTWSQLTASFTETAAHGVFSESYDAGQIVDPVSVSYTGDGGVPVVEETWTPAGSTTLTPQAGDVSGEWANGSVRVIWSEPDTGAAGVAHVLLPSFTGGSAQLQAYDLATLAPVGTPMAFSASFTPSFVDSGRQTVYYSSTGSAVDRALRWDAGTGTYQVTSITPFTIKGRAAGLLWDDAHDRAYSFQRVVPAGAGATAYDLHQWYLRTYTRTETPDGAGGTTVSFVEDSYLLPSGPTGFNRVWYSIYGGVAALAPDGSIVMPSVTSAPTGAGIEWGAQRITLTTDPEAVPGSGQGTVSVTTVPGTDLSTSGQSRYTGAYPTPHGVVLVRPGTTTLAGQVQQLRLTDEGEIVTSHGPVTLPAGTLSTFVVDPDDDTVWSKVEENQHLVGVRAGRVVHDTQQPLISQRSTGLVVTADHDVYALSNGTASVGPFTSAPWGLVRFAWQGYSPTVTTSPQSETVTLSTADATRQVTLEAAGSGTPEPTITWQRRTAGDLRFADLDPGTPGIHGGELDVSVTAATDGTAYRAVLSNAAGSIATAAATITVRTPPTVTRQPARATVVEGTPATFDTLATGSPEPTVTWQRRANGFWQNIDADDDNFQVVGASLTVPQTNTDQSGSLFRARLTNAVATTYTNPAELTVNRAATDQTPRTVTGGSLDWGVKASFRTYVRGPIAHGEITVSGGASTNSDGTIRFPATGGTYDPSGAGTDVALSGTVRFSGHNSASGPELDLKITDPALRWKDGTGVLTADVVSRDMETGVTRSYPDVELAALDTGAGITADANALTLGEVPATLTADGAPAFAGFYTAGTALDPLDAALTLGDRTAGPVPAASATSVTLRRGTSPYGAGNIADVRVVAGGLTPTGQVTLTVGGQRTTASLTAGAAAVRLPGLVRPGRRPVTVRYEGSPTVAASTAGVVVHVTKGQPKLALTVGRRAIRADQRLRVTVRVDVPGPLEVQLTGRLVVRDGGRTVATVGLTRARNGVVTVRLPRLRAGAHVLTATLPSSSLYARSESGKRTVRVSRTS